jgi:hypothetical protein
MNAMQAYVVEDMRGVKCIVVVLGFVHQNLLQHHFIQLAHYAHTSIMLQ